MADQREFKIGVLAGDGIGPEITDATIEVLHAASELTGLKLRLMHRRQKEARARFKYSELM